MDQLLFGSGLVLLEQVQFDVQPAQESLEQLHLRNHGAAYESHGGQFEQRVDVRISGVNVAPDLLNRQVHHVQLVQQAKQLAGDRAQILDFGRLTVRTIDA